MPKRKRFLNLTHFLQKRALSHFLPFDNFWWQDLLYLCALKKKIRNGKQQADIERQYRLWQHAHSYSVQEAADSYRTGYGIFGHLHHHGWYFCGQRYWQRCAGSGQHHSPVVPYQHRSGADVRHRSIGGGIYPPVARQTEGGTHQRDTGHHRFVPAAYCLCRGHPVQRGAGGTPAGQQRTVAAAGCGIHALVCAVPGVQRPAQLRHVFRQTGRLAQLRHDMQHHPGTDQHLPRLAVYLRLPVGHVRSSTGYQPGIYCRSTDDTGLPDATAACDPAGAHQAESEKPAADRAQRGLHDAAGTFDLPV
ncbi:unknown [Bacteroides sp. CAG:633]|nr:unknown [Bacteroides sp. CAG:633]